MMRLTFKSLYRIAKDEMQEIQEKLQRAPLMIKDSSRTYFEKCSQYQQLNHQLQGQLNSLKTQMSVPKLDSMNSNSDRDYRLAQAEALSEKLAEKLTRTQEE